MRACERARVLVRFHEHHETLKEEEIGIFFNIFCSGGENRLCSLLFLFSVPANTVRESYLSNCLHQGLRNNLIKLRVKIEFGRPVSDLERHLSVALIQVD